MDDFGSDIFTKVGAGIAAIGLGGYGGCRLFKNDRREDKNVTLTDSAMTQVIQTLRDEVARMAVRLEKVEEENRKCEERNAELQQQIIELKLQLKIA